MLEADLASKVEVCCCVPIAEGRDCAHGALAVALAVAVVQPAVIMLRLTYGCVLVLPRF